MAFQKRTVISHRNISYNLLEDSLALDILFVLGFRFLELFAKLLRGL